MTQRALLAAVGWLTLLLACVDYDLGHVRRADRARADGRRARVHRTLDERFRMLIRHDRPTRPENHFVIEPARWDLDAAAEWAAVALRQSRRSIAPLSSIVRELLRETRSRYPRDATRVIETAREVARSSVVSLS